MDVALVWFKPNGNRKDFALGPGTTVIGRGDGCSLQIPLVGVSRRHCEVICDGDVVKVKDLASSNGSYVNNDRVNEAEFQAGDRLVIGPIVFTVQVDGKPEEIQPVKTRGQKMAEEKAASLSGATAVPLGDDSEDDAFLAMLDETKNGEESDDVDPISALEALAGEDE